MVLVDPPVAYPDVGDRDGDVDFSNVGATWRWYLRQQNFPWMFSLRDVTDGFGTKHKAHEGMELYDASDMDDGDCPRRDNSGFRKDACFLEMFCEHRYLGGKDRVAPTQMLQAWAASVHNWRKDPIEVLLMLQKMWDEFLVQSPLSSARKR